MIPNCPGCEEEFLEIIEYSNQGLYFAGKSLFEKGHLIMIMVNDKGEIIVGQMRKNNFLEFLDFLGDD